MEKVIIFLTRKILLENQQNFTHKKGKQCFKQNGD